MKTKIILLTLVLAAGAAPAARAEISLPPLPNINLDIRLGRRQPPPPPAVVVVQEEPRRGPDRWEQRGRWNSRSHGYYYYPGGDVYYRQSDHVWFYMHRGQWRSSRNLPDGIHVDFNRSVTVNMYTDRPYTYHSQIVARYPSNYFGTRVRLRDDDRRDHDRRDNNGRNDNSRRGNDHDNRDSDGDGRDKDRGNRK
jgi:hypothetical protein